MSNDLLIKINADAESAKKAFDDMQAKTEDLRGTLEKTALISGIVFAAFTAEVYESVKAFEQARESSVRLSAALQDQGIFSEELKGKYEGYAKAVEASTGINADAIIKAQATAQGFLGQVPITQELTNAIADLGAKNGDLNEAAEKIARTIGTGTNAFARQGLVIQQGATEAERYAQVLAFVQLKAGGLAEDMNKADGYSKALATSFEHFQETIGAGFAPVVEACRRVMIAFFDAFTNNKLLGDMAIALLTAAGAVAGIITVIAIAVPAFLALQAAAVATGIALNFALLGIPIAIAAIVAGITLLALNWNAAMASIKAAAVGALTLMTEMFSGFGTLLKGVFTLDPQVAAKGLDQIMGSFKKAKDVAVQTYVEIRQSQQVEGEQQNADKKALADKAAAIEAAHQALLRSIRETSIAILKLQNEHASADLISLKSKELETLKALEATKDAREIAALKTKYAQLTALEKQQSKEDQERQIAFGKIQADTKEELNKKGIKVNATIRDQRLAEIQATANTEEDIDRQLQENIMKTRIAAYNQELMDRKKYGETAAIINKALHSDEVQGAKSAAGELVQLQQSKNETLKTIGKIAAVGQITISTAESAMNIYEGFSTIPIVGPALGVIGAAAAVAFGAERIATVVAAADGGLITGGIPGVDSVPAMLMPGELVVPTKNFDQVVGAVQGSGSAGGNDNSAQMLQTLQDIDSKISTPQQTIIQGDVLSDDTYVDALVRRISDAIEFRNGKIFGVNI